MNTKVCKVCGEIKPLKDFHKMTKSKDGHQNRCKPCAVSLTREYERRRGYKITPEVAREALLKNRFGITSADYNKIFEEQDGKCAICRKDQIEFTKRFAVDHDHTHGFIRGLLCDMCNRGIGCFYEDATAIETAAKYLRDHEI